MCLWSLFPPCPSRCLMGVRVGCLPTQLLESFRTHENNWGLLGSFLVLLHVKSSATFMLREGVDTRNGPDSVCLQRFRVWTPSVQVTGLEEQSMWHTGKKSNPSNATLSVGFYFKWSGIVLSGEQEILPLQFLFVINMPWHSTDNFISTND